MFGQCTVILLLSNGIAYLESFLLTALTADQCCVLGLRDAFHSCPFIHRLGRAVLPLMLTDAGIVAPSSLGV